MHCVNVPLAYLLVVNISLNFLPKWNIKSTASKFSSSQARSKKKSAWLIIYCSCYFDLE